MKKKEKTTPLLGIIVVIVLVLSAFGMVWFGIKINKFDQEKDVCLKEKLYCRYSEELIIKEGYSSHERWYVINDLSNPYEETSCGRSLVYKKECTKHRQKTICEKCSDKADCNKEVDEGKCVCDELYNGTEKCLKARQDCLKKAINDPQLSCHYPDCNKVWCIKSHLQQTPIKMNLEKDKCKEWTNNSNQFTFEYSNRKFYTNCEKENLCYKSKDCLYAGGLSAEYVFNKYCCLKKEPKNECEKGNKKYQWVEPCKNNFDGIIELFCEEGLCTVSDNSTCTSMGKKCMKVKNIKKYYEELNEPYLPCILGNPDWVWDKTNICKTCKVRGNISLGMNWTVEWTTDSEDKCMCVEYEKFCRKKTKEDALCPELWNYYNMSCWDRPLLGCGISDVKFEIYDRQDALKEYLDRCIQ